MPIQEVLEDLEKHGEISLQLCILASFTCKYKLCANPCLRESRLHFDFANGITLSNCNFVTLQTRLHFATLLNIIVFVVAYVHPANFKLTVPRKW